MAVSIFSSSFSSWGLIAELDVMGHPFGQFGSVILETLDPNLLSGLSVLAEQSGEVESQSCAKNDLNTGVFINAILDTDPKCIDPSQGLQLQKIKSIPGRPSIKKWGGKGQKHFSLYISSQCSMSFQGSLTKEEEYFEQSLSF